MRAIRVHEFDAPEVIHFEEIPDPKRGSGEVVIQTRATGVNPVDAYVRSGAYAKKPSLPYTPGTDAGGVVESVGERIALTAGMRVS